MIKADDTAQKQIANQIRKQDEFAKSYQTKIQEQIREAQMHMLECMNLIIDHYHKKEFVPDPVKLLQDEIDFNKKKIEDLTVLMEKNNL